MSRVKLLVLIGGLVVLAFQPALAQDVHYWTHQYGTRSTLLGGAVVGSVLDLSGTYYNPGGLSLIETEDVELLMFAKAFRYPKITLKGIGLEDWSVSTSALEEAPSLVAGSLPIKGLGKHWLGYSFLNRHETEFGLAGAGTGVFPLSSVLGSDNPGAVDLRLFESLSEPWYGVTWAYRFTEKFGLGISNYLAFRSHQLSYQSAIQVLDEENRVKMVLDSRDYQYNHYRILWKIGAAYDFELFTLGLTLTTPGIKLYGNGRIGQNSTVVRYDPGNPDLMAVDYQTELKSAYKSPFSVSLGLTYKLGLTNFYGTLEWFGGIDEYVVLPGEDFTAQSSGETFPSRVTHEMDAVLNVAVGAEQVLSPTFTLYGSFWTDFSARTDGTTTNLSVTDWDLFHFMGGATFAAIGFQFSLGMGYSFGSEEGMPRQRTAGPAIQDIAGRYLSDLDYSYSSFKWILGFSF
jgi:hypothetical protein